MKKRWLFILAVLMIAATMFVACNSEVTDARASAQPGEELVYATFGGGSKDLSVDYDFIDYTQLYWFYQATKEDHYGTTGAVTGDNWAKVPGDSEGKGLDGTVGPFSQGLWSFNLAGYQTKGTEQPSGDYIQYGDYYYSGLVYSGASTGTVSLKYGDSNAIPVTVQPYGDTGKIYLDGIIYSWVAPDEDPADVTLQIKITPVEGSSWTDSKTWSYNSGYTLTGYVLNNNLTPSVDIPTGTYNLEFTVCAIENNSVAYEFAKQSLSLTVFGSQTTTVTGSLVEGLFVKNAHFVATDVASVIVIPTTTGADFETDKTPAGSDGSKKTTVSVPTGTLTTGTQNNMTIELVSIDIAQDVASQKSWTVASDSSAVAALTITLKEVVTTTDPTTGSVTVEEKPITTFDKAVTVTTYIETGLTGVQVFYNGDLAQPTDVTYDATTGCLTFKTTHFSEFYITSKSEVLNVETGVKYTTLADAVDKAVAGQTLRLIKDITDPGLVINKSIILDLYGNTWACTDVSPTKTNNRAVKITAGKVVITSSRDGGKITDGYYQEHFANLEDYTETDSNLLYGCIRVEKDGEVEINNVTLENFRGNGLNVKVIGGKATLDKVTINSIYGGGIEVTSVLWATKKYSVLPEEIGYAKLTNCTMTQDKYHDWCSVPVSVSGGADVDVYSTEYEGVYGVYVFSSGGTINIFGGSFTANGNTAQTPFVAKQVIKCAYDAGYDYTDYEHEGEHYSFSGSCNVNVYNGTINGNISTDSRSHVLAYGGTFDNDPSAYVAPGYYAKENTPTSGLWTVESVFPGKGTENDPFTINGTDEWMKLVALTKDDSSYQATRGKYFKLTGNVDVSNVANAPANIRYFAGHMDFNNQVLTGFNEQNVYWRFDSDGNVAVFTNVIKDVSFKNLEYPLIKLNGEITNNKSVILQLAGVTYEDNTSILFKNIVLTGGVIGVSGNNKAPLMYGCVYSKGCSITVDSCVNNATIIGSGFSSAFIGSINYMQGDCSVTFKDCVNNGTIMSTDKKASMLAGNGNSYQSPNMNIYISGCENNGKVIGWDSSNLVVCMTDASGTWKINDNAVNLSTLKGNIASVGGITGNNISVLNVLNLDSTTDTFVLNKSDNAKYYQLQFAFTAGGSHAGGNVAYTLQFGSLEQPYEGDLPSIVVKPWVDKSNATGSIEAIYGNYGVLYTDGAHYVFNEDNTSIVGNVYVSFIAYGENNTVLAVYGRSY